LGEPNWPNLPQMPPTQLLPKRRGQLAPTYAFARHLAIGVGMDGQRPCRTLAEDPGRTQPRAAYPRAAAQTRVVSLGGIRLRSWESARVFKGIICADVSEFESYMPSHAVGSLWRVYPVCVFALFRRGRKCRQIPSQLAQVPGKVLSRSRRRSRHPARLRWLSYGLARATRG